jgi:hypothetical protein
MKPRALLFCVIALSTALGVLLCTTPGAAQPPTVTVVRDLDYVATVEYPDGKDRLDVYVPQGARNAPVIFSLHGGELSMGDRREDSFVGQRFAAAGSPSSPATVCRRRSRTPRTSRTRRRHSHGSNATSGSTAATLTGFWSSATRQAHTLRCCWRPTHDGWPRTR